MSARESAPYGRLRWAALGAAVALVLVGVAWLLTSLIKSPQDALASAEPPPPSRITVPVAQRSLDRSVVTSGRLETPTRVVGLLAVDQRAGAQRATEVVVRTAGREVRGTLREVSPRGRFLVDVSQPLPAKAGADVEVVFGAGDQGVETLVVPISAVFESSGGQTAVVVLRKGQEHEVRVDLGDVVDGFAAIAPVGGADLAEGDQVLVSEPGS